MAKTQTTRFNLQGWNFKTWAVKNKDNLKLIVAGVAGLATLALTNLSTPYGLALGGLVTTVSKILMDTVDYWQAE